MKLLKKYQQQAIDKLISRTKEFLKEKGQETIVFQAPTGSGKTFMMINYINNIVKEIEDDICFLWISPGDGKLAYQSYKSIKRDIDDSFNCAYLEDEFFGSRDKIEQNEIVVFPWDLVNKKKRGTNEWVSTAMRDKDTYNFIEVLENTRRIQRKIILIIDECHKATDTKRALELRDVYINPELTIEMSATPVLKNESDSKITVDSADVIEEGMIKKEVLINPNIKETEDDEIDSQKLIINCAIKKRQQLAEKYKKIGSKVNPLVLIQIPNSEEGEDKKNAILSILRDYGITEENGKIAIWLSDEKINNESDILLPIDGKVEYLIFKQAIDTGWDCPRAQILVKFREIKSITFEIQTVGRILRMPEAFHYEDDELNKAFVYTNIQSIIVKKEVYNPNIIKNLISNRKDIYKPLKLKSYYKQRVDYGDITSSFYDIFENTFCKYFKIQKTNIPNYSENMKKLKKYGVATNFDKMDSIIENENISSQNIDEFDEKITVNLFDVNYSEEDLETKFEKIIKDNLNGFAPKRSLSTVKQAIYRTFQRQLNIKAYKGGSLYIQNLIVKNENIFSILLDKATFSYKEVHEEEVRKKSKEKYNEEWEILPSRNYNQNTHMRYNLELSLYQPLYILKDKNGEPNQLETDFLDYINTKKDKIEWIWQNGQEPMEINFGIKKEDGYAFRPDFLIKFKDGRIGIFDTKGIGDREEDNKEKATALVKYIEEERIKGKNIIGGLVIKDGTHFRINQQENYKPYRKAPEEWEYFEKIL